LNNPFSAESRFLLGGTCAATDGDGHEKGSVEIQRTKIQAIYQSYSKKLFRHSYVYCYGTSEAVPNLQVK